MPDPIIFVDLDRNEERARGKLQDLHSTLQKRAKKTGLTHEEQKTLDKLRIVEALLEHQDPIAIEPEWVALNGALIKSLPRRTGRWVLADHTDGMMPSQQRNPGLGGLLASGNELEFGAIYGAIHSEGLPEPDLDIRLRDGATVPQPTNPPDPVQDARNLAAAYELYAPSLSSRFAETIVRSTAFYRENERVLVELFKVLAEAEDVVEGGKVDLTDWWAIGKALVERGADADDPNLPAVIRVAIDDHFGRSSDGYSSAFDIVLPDLEADTEREIQRSNLEAAQAIYFAAMMDEARMFDVVEKLAELFQMGALSLQNGFAGQYLYEWIRNTPERMSTYERHNLYARVFGAPTGEPNGVGHTFRNFDELWIRFVSAVSDWYRKHQVENLFTSAGGFVASQEQMRKTGLDLGVNLSLYCYGSAFYAARELNGLVHQYRTLLNNHEIKHLYGARDLWQVIDQVSLLEFGRPTNTIRARTMANAGAVIIGWLAKKSNLLSAPGAARIIDPAEVRNPRIRPNIDAVNDPNDYDLVAACEQWLAIEGVGEDVIDVKSAASPSASGATLPVRVPPAAQEVLGAFGFGHQGGGDNGHGYGAAARRNANGRLLA